MIATALLLLAGQAGAAAPPPEVPASSPDSFSVLWDPCPAPQEGKEVVVCGGRGPSRLPLPEERGPPDHPVPSNPELSASAALDGGGSCTAVQGGCQAGIDLLGAATALVRLTQKAISPNSCCEDHGESTNPGYLARDMVRGVKTAFRHKPDKSGRVPINLDAAPPSIEGRVLP